MQTIHVSTEPTGILLLTFKGEIINRADVKSLKSDIVIVSKTIKEMYEKQNKGIKVLIEITGLLANYVGEGVDALVSLAKQDKVLVEKTAIFGGEHKVKMIAEIIIALSGRTNIKFFENKFKALEWLNS